MAKKRPFVLNKGSLKLFILKAYLTFTVTDLLF
jgi:hypothetical protein